METKNLLKKITEAFTALIWGHSRFYKLSGKVAYGRYIKPRAFFFAGSAIYIALTLTLLKDRDIGGRSGFDVIITDVQKQYEHANGLNGSAAIIIVFLALWRVLTLLAKLLKFNLIETNLFINTVFYYVTLSILTYCGLIFLMYFIEDDISIRLYRWGMLTLDGRKALLWFNYRHYLTLAYVLPPLMFCWAIIRASFKRKRVLMYLPTLVLIIFATDILDNIHKCCFFIMHPVKETVFIKGSIGPDKATGLMSDRIKYYTVLDTIANVTHYNIDLYIYNSGDNDEIIPRTDSLYLRIANDREYNMLNNGIHPNDGQWRKFTPHDGIVLGISKFENGSDKYMTIGPHETKWVTFTIDVAGGSMFNRTVLFFADAKVKVAKCRFFRPSGNYHIDPQTWFYHDVVQGMTFEFFHV